MMNSLFLQVESVLRGAPLETPRGAKQRAPHGANADGANADGANDGVANERGALVAKALSLVVCVALFGGLYGAAMGAFGGARPLQMLVSALKVPLLLLVTGGLSVPSFWVLYSLWGLRDDFNAVLRGLLSAQVGLAVVLASLSPFTLLWYASGAPYGAAIAFNAVMFGIASLSAQVLLRRHCKPLMQRDARHRKLLWAWLALYAFLGIQMSWMLRPFIGDPRQPTTFFRAEGWSNAYEVFGRKIFSPQNRETTNY